MYNFYRPIVVRDAGAGKPGTCPLHPSRIFEKEKFKFVEEENTPNINTKN
jgi:hypothetical protein